MEIGLVISAFIAGLITFLAPCTLPLVPAYLGFISGVDQRDLKHLDAARSVRRKIILNGLFFVIGFSVVFVVFGTLAGLLGSTLVPYRIWLTRIGGIFVVLFGLFMLGVFRIRIFQSEHRMKMPAWLELGKPSSSLIVGGTFAFGWTPCVGPILGSILLLATSSTTALQGAVMLAVFSAGLAVPFLLVAVGFSRATQIITNISVYLKWVSIIGGLFLILIGILLIADQFGLTIQYGFRIMEFLGLTRYEEILLDYL